MNAPETDTETLRRLEQIVRDKLGSEATGPIDADTPMTEAGLDSLAMAEVAWEIEDQFGLSLTPEDFQAAGTLRGLAGIVAKRGTPSPGTATG